MPRITVFAGAGPLPGRSRALLRDSLGRDDLTIGELVSRAEALLAVPAPRQTRYEVADRPDGRTIRYYTSQGLLPKPVSCEGGRAQADMADAGTPLCRLVLAPDVTLDVPDAVFTDPARRRAPAASLESLLARTLRDQGRAPARGKKPGGKR